MNYEECIKKINRYLRREADTQPLLIDVQNWPDMEKLYEAVGNVKMIAVSDYCKKDEFPRLENFFADVKQCEKTCVITEFSSFLGLLGEQELKSKLNELLNMSAKNHIIVFTYQCEEYLHTKNRHIQSHICILSGTKEVIPKINFCGQAFCLPNNIIQMNGLENLPSIIKHTEVTQVYLYTSKTKEQYPLSLYTLADISDAYDILSLKDIQTKNLNKLWGTEEQWQFALEKFNQYGNWYDFIKNEINGDPERLDIYLTGLQSLSQDKYSQNKVWLYFIGLKLYGSKNNLYLDESVKNASSCKKWEENIYCDILQKNVNEPDYWKCYEDRKRILCQIKNSTIELNRYCKLVKSKGKDAIFYLTDLSGEEKKTLFACLDKFGLKYNRKTLFSILEKIYPELYYYLLPYDFKDELLNNYFQDYKYQKVINKVFPEFYSIVLEQAKKRDYNLILEPRSVKIENLAKPKSKLYFVDAMGVEYLSYITSICKKLRLMLEIKICRAELPTITSKNKEFEDEWRKKNIPVIAIKELDDIKHHGKEEFDYYHGSKLPIYLIKELDIIKKILRTIQTELGNGNIDEAVMIADHGASRLAVLYDNENIWEMAEKGQHSGRCCLKSELDTRPDCAVDAGDFWSLANYDRFKGGRKANVEVHGGATLEEICVPIISIRRLREDMSKDINVILKNIDGEDFKGIPEVKVSFRKKAAIIVFITEKLPDIYIVVHGKKLSNERKYTAIPIKNEMNRYRVDMPDIKKAGKYYLDIYSGDTMIAKKPLIIKKEGQQERTLL